MSVNKNCLIYVTVKNKKEGIYISKLVIEKKLATKLFGYSILYLFMIFTFVLVDKVI